MIAHEKALDWQELFELAVQQALSDEELKDTAYRVSGMFSHAGQLCRGRSRLSRGSCCEEADLGSRECTTRLRQGRARSRHSTR